MTCAALMAVIYSDDLFAQARFFRGANSSFIIHHSSICPA
jgi:hypothetical protein